MQFTLFRLPIWLVFAVMGLISVTSAQAHIVDADGRKAPEAFFAQTDAPKPEAFASVGSLYCGLAGIRVTAQVVVEKDLLMTAAHVFFYKENHQMVNNLSGCFFEPFFGVHAGKRFMLRLETLRIFTSNNPKVDGFDYKKDFTRDLALVRLDLNHSSLAKDEEVRFQPLSLEVPSEANRSGQYLLSAVDGGPKTIYDFSPAIQSCNERDVDVDESLGLVTRLTDCDIQNHGPSGAGFLNITPTGTSVSAILVGFYGNKPGPYAKTTNSTVMVGLTSKVQEWILNYSRTIK